MKLSSKILVASMVASMALGVIGCKGKPPEPPIAISVTESVANGAKISIASFNIEQPDFLDNDGRAVKAAEGQEEVAVLHLKIENSTGGEIAYKPSHFENSRNRIQLCTDPDPETGKRLDVKAINFEGASRYHTANQYISSTVTIPAGSSIEDEYLFDIPNVGDSKLVALIPGAMFGDTSGKVYRFYVPKAEKKAKAAPKKLNEENNIAGVSVKVTKVANEYVEIIPATAPEKPLKYAYAYSEKPVMAVYVKIDNKSDKDISYDPQHAVAKVAGVDMKFADKPLPRVRLKNGVYGKGQVSKSNISIPKGKSQEDVYYFEVPGSKGELEFNLSGVLKVPGIYRFKLNFTPVQLQEPDLKPYEKEAAAAAE